MKLLIIMLLLCGCSSKPDPVQKRSVVNILGDRVECDEASIPEWMKFEVDPNKWITKKKE